MKMSIKEVVDKQMNRWPYIYDMLKKIKKVDISDFSIDDADEDEDKKKISYKR